MAKSKKTKTQVWGLLFQLGLGALQKSHIVQRKAFINNGVAIEFQD